MYTKMIWTHGVITLKHPRPIAQYELCLKLKSQKSLRVYFIWSKPLGVYDALNLENTENNWNNFQ